MKITWMWFITSMQVYEIHSNCSFVSLWFQQTIRWRILNSPPQESKSEEYSNKTTMVCRKRLTFLLQNTIVQSSNANTLVQFLKVKRPPLIIKLGGDYFLTRLAFFKQEKVSSGHQLRIKRLTSFIQTIRCKVKRHVDTVTPHRARKTLQAIYKLHSSSKR